MRGPFRSEDVPHIGQLSRYPVRQKKVHPVGAAQSCFLGRCLKEDGVLLVLVVDEIVLWMSEFFPNLQRLLGLH